MMVLSLTSNLTENTGKSWTKDYGSRKSIGLDSPQHVNFQNTPITWSIAAIVLLTPSTKKSNQMTYVQIWTADTVGIHHQKRNSQATWLIPAQGSYPSEGNSLNSNTIWRPHSSLQVANTTVRFRRLVMTPQIRKSPLWRAISSIPISYDFPSIYVFTPLVFISFSWTL